MDAFSDISEERTAFNYRVTNLGQVDVEVFGNQDQSQFHFGRLFSLPGKQLVFVAL